MSVRWFRVILVAVLITFVITGCSDRKEDKTPSENTNKNRDIESEDTDLTKASAQELSFSLRDHFYSEDIEVEIFSNKPGLIYYTMDGKEPDQDETLYKEAIKLEAHDDVAVYSIKAKVFYEDGTVSDTLVHTYFVGKNIDERFTTMVFAITTDPYNLYDYEYGIFVEGKLRDDYIKENPYVVVDPDDPANYNMRGRESEREVYLEVFEADGTKVIAQAAGIRTYGGWSRAREQKSIRLFARKDYDQENNKFRYEFFPFKSSADGYGNELDSFKQLVVRNCGNDNGFAFIRDELFQMLAGQAGYLDYEAVRPVTLFINGDYRGFYWLHEVYCDEYFEDHYGDYSGNFEILEGGETYKKLDNDGDNKEAVEDYDSMYYTYCNKDLTDDIIYQELCNLIDVENYLSYYALQIYIGNEDWPHNNYRTYRYYTAEGEAYREAPFDGKWRYLLHDLDFSFGIYGTGAMTNNISSYVGKKGEIKDACPLFGQLMKREDCREIFIKKTLDLLNGAFAPDNLEAVLDEMNASRITELKNMYGKNLMEDWVQYEQLQERLQTIRDYANVRSEYILELYQEHFGMGEIYTIGVEPAEGCSVKINSYVTDEYFEGSYYTDYNTSISAILPKGKKLAYWLVNGEKHESQELLVTPAMLIDNIAEISFIVK